MKLEWRMKRDKGHTGTIDLFAGHKREC
jgi:hypothetical protein